LHVSGIIGSLRWWYEAIIRGLGGDACDPAGYDKCKFDLKEFQKDKNKGENEQDALERAGLCDACKIFGATGWSRRLRVKIDEHQIMPAWNGPTLNIRPPDRSRGWFLNPGHWGTFTLILHGEKTILEQLADLILFLEQWGALGAKNQLGYGVFRLENRKEIEQYAGRWRWFVTGNKPAGECPDLRRFGFFNLRFKTENDHWWTYIPALERLLGEKNTARALKQTEERGMIPLAPVLKNTWRFHDWQGPFSIAQWLFGASRGEEDRVRSKVNVSWAYRNGEEWEMRGWVWLPPKDGNGQVIASQHLQKLWECFCNENIWSNVLKINSPELVFRPAERRWRGKTPEEVRGFLEESICSSS